MGFLDGIESKAEAIGNFLLVRNALPETRDWLVESQAFFSGLNRRSQSSSPFSLT
jgi:hypothetical protein